jgi:predicted MFS family arabinose efflux permease
VLTESRGEPAPVDLTGIALVSTGLLGIVWATVRGNEAGWGAPVTLAAYASGAALLAAFVAWEARTRAPMLPLRLFRSRTFSAANTAGFAFSFAMFASFLLIVQRLAADGYSPLMVGVWTLPWTIMPLLVSPAAGRLSERVDPALLLAGGMALITVSVLALAAVIGSPAAMAAPLAGIGIGVGFVAPSLSAVTMGSVGPADIGRASATLNTSRQLGAVFGVAVAVAVFGAGGFGAAVLVAGVVAAAATAVVALTWGGLELIGAQVS